MMGALTRSGSRVPPPEDGEGGVRGTLELLYSVQFIFLLYRVEVLFSVMGRMYRRGIEVGGKRRQALYVLQHAQHGDSTA